MSQDPNLYGRRPAKKQKHEMALSDTLDFAAQLRSLMGTRPGKAAAETATATATTAPATSSATPLALSKPGSRKRKDDPLASVRIKRRRQPSDNDNDNDNDNGSSSSNRLRLKLAPTGSAAALDADERDRIRRSMEAKARRYAALQRGDYVPSGRGGDQAAPLVDFDRKWAERRSRRGGGHAGSSGGSGSDSESGSGSDDGGDGSTVEYVDEFGRTRHVTRAQRDRLQRRRDRAERAARDLEAMRARPAPPSSGGDGDGDGGGRGGVIYGDVIQTEAVETAMDRLGQHQKSGVSGEDDDDRDTHYRAEEDVRTRGAAFYAFSADDETARAAQMQALAAERARTEAARAESAAQADARRQQLDARRRLLDDRRAALAARRAHKLADSFLDGLEQDLLVGGSGESGEKKKKADAVPTAAQERENAG